MWSYIGTFECCIVTYHAKKKQVVIESILHRLVRSSYKRTNHFTANGKSLTPLPLLHPCTYLVEGVGAGSPVGEEHGETDGLSDAGSSTDGDGVQGTLLGDDLGDDLWEVSDCPEYRVVE